MLLALAGIGCTLSGLLWSTVFPVIKLLWTSSFVLIGGGFGFIMLSLFYWIIEVKGNRRWAFIFSVIGMNSITVYVAAMLINFRQISDIFIGSLLPRLGPWDDFVSETVTLAIIWLVLYWMYRTKTFVKI
jgi:predicted acyltransferase